MNRITLYSRTSGAVLPLLVALAQTSCASTTQTPKASASVSASMAETAKEDRPGSLVGDPSAGAASTDVAPVAGPVQIRRSAVKRAIQAGPPAFLQKVELDDRPVVAQGRFRGFRLNALRGDKSFWSGVDLKPGDVVTKVNGLPVERPEDMIRVFDSLKSAKEVRVDYEREGAAKTFAVPIVEDDAAPIAPASRPTN